MKELIIAEKPSLAREIAKTLGIKSKDKTFFENEKYIITFAYGHLMVLKDVDEYLNREKTSWKLNELPFVPKRFEFKIREDKGVKIQYDNIEKTIKRKDVSSIINAGDADREGEVIINNIIYSILRKNKIDKPIKRLWLHAQNEEGIKKAMSELKDISETKTLYSEGLARTYIDWMYGINLTRYLTVISGDLLPVGRVLIPIVKKVYDRAIEIENFKPQKYYEVEANIHKDGQIIKAILKDSKFNIEEKDKAEALIEKLKDREFPVVNINKRKVEKNPKKLFSLTTLQNNMAKKHKIGLEETLKTAQSLYEKGYITYPRTNTEYLTNAEKNDIKNLINIYKNHGYNLIFKDKKTIFDDSKVESHSALLVTSKSPNFDRLSEKEKLIYSTILNRFISNFLNEKTIVEEVKVKIQVDDKYIELKGNTIIEEGFYKYEKPDQSEKILPEFKKGEMLKIDFELAEKETTPPKKLTLDELNTYLQNPFKKEIKEIEDDEKHFADDEEYKQILSGIEIGTVATRDSIIKNAEKYKYISIKKTTLDITEKGRYLIETLDNLKINMTKEKTVESSMMLKSIYKNETRVDNVVLKIQDDLRKSIDKSITVKKIKKEYTGKNKRISCGKCPICGRNIYENTVAFYCEGYNKEPKCNFNIWKNNPVFVNNKIKVEKNIIKTLLKNEIYEYKTEENGIIKIQLNTKDIKNPIIKL